MKKLILFVDDEEEVLNGLKRMLRTMRKDWDMKFVESGEKALEILAENSVDVVMSDMRMPVMDGAQLLAEITEKYPSVVRIILSGHSEQEMIMKSVGTAHQYLAKPCSSEVLKATVERTCSLRDLLMKESLQRVVSTLKTVPSMPTLYMEIISELKSPNSSMARVGKIVSKDISMTAKILQIVNSAFFGLPVHVANPSQAVNLLGMDTIKTLVLSVNVFSKFKQSTFGKISMAKIWNHSLATAACAREIAKLEKMDVKLIDDSFMGGMLHDIGKIILAHNMPEKYSEALALSKNENIRLRKAEFLVFGAAHPEVGGYLLGLWGLPDPIVEPTFFHNRPLHSSDKTFTTTTAVHVANVIVAREFPEYTVGNLQEVDMKYLDEIGKTELLTKWTDGCIQVIERIKADEFKDFIS